MDRTAQSGVTYYYQLQEVERDGRLNTHGPISVRTGMDWRRAAVLISTAGAVLALWWRGGRLRWPKSDT